MAFEKSGLKLNLNGNPTLEIHTHQLFLLNAEHRHAVALLSEAISGIKTPRVLGGAGFRGRKEQHEVTV